MTKMDAIDASLKIVQEEFDTAKRGKYESLFTLGNGFLGLRGDCELPGYASQRGTYINGFYESGPITYGEKAYGYAERWQTMIALPEGKAFHWKIDGAVLHRDGALTIRDRHLNMQSGTLEWSFEWQHPNGYVVTGKVVRIVPFDSKGACLISWEIDLPNTGLAVSLKHGLAVSYANHGSHDPRLPEHFKGDTVAITERHISSAPQGMTITATGSDLSAVALAGHLSEGVNWEEPRCEETAQGIEWRLQGDTAATTLRFTKVLAYDYGKSESITSCTEQTRQALAAMMAASVEEHLQNQQRYLADFWRDCMVLTGADTETQESLLYNLFQLLQSTGRDGNRSIAAKGLSGLGYEGHFFWDAETYVLPFFTYTKPEIARSMLQYRISGLEKARQRARKLNHRGVLFPWRTINGEEASAYYPAGTAQYHINADIALALARYLEATGDNSLLAEGGAELLAETARFWMDLGSWSEKGFGFYCVTGPDEYTALVDNNFYTNMAAKNNLLAAVKFVSGDKTLAQQIGVTDTEIADWQTAAEAVYLPLSNRITPQDDSFLAKERWDFAATEAKQYPLLLHFHPLNIYRKQVQKQADVVMAMVQNPDAFSPALYRRNLAYYEETTTRDSSLSACAQGIAANRAGYDELAWEYFLETLHTDRKDLHGNVDHGLHTASMGGSYLMVICGFLGLDFFQGMPRFRPRLPVQLPCLSVNLVLQGRRLNLELSDTEIRLRLLAGNALEIMVFGNRKTLREGSQETCPMVPDLVGLLDVKSATETEQQELQAPGVPVVATLQVGESDSAAWEDQIHQQLNRQGLLPEQVLAVCRDHATWWQVKQAYPTVNLADTKGEEVSISWLKAQHQRQVGKVKAFAGKRPKKVPHRGVLFDLDGVITDTAEFHNRAWIKITDQLGMKFDEKMGDAVRGISRRDSFLLILAANKKQMSDADIDHWITLKNDLYKQSLVEAMDASHILPGVTPLLEGLQARGILCGLASASHNAPYILEKLGLKDFFKDIVRPDSVARGKPAPDLFSKGCELLGLPPQQVVGVEDAVAGLQGIIDAGMYAIGVGTHPGLEIADRLLPDLTHYRKIIEVFE